jgi:DNA-binding XRE family transcriptional regulator
MADEITITALPDDILNAHHFISSGLDNYWLSEKLFVADYIDGDTYYSYSGYDNIMATIGLHICTLPRLLGAREIKFLRAKMGKSQITLAKEVGYTDDQVISRAESLKTERRQPLPSAEDALIRIFYLRCLKTNADMAPYLHDKTEQIANNMNAERSTIGEPYEDLLVA